MESGPGAQSSMAGDHVSATFSYRIGLVDQNRRDFERYELFMAVDDRDRFGRPRNKSLHSCWRPANEEVAEHQ